MHLFIFLHVDMKHLTHQIHISFADVYQHRCIQQRNSKAEHEEIPYIMFHINLSLTHTCTNFTGYKGVSKVTPVELRPTWCNSSVKPKVLTICISEITPKSGLVQLPKVCDSRDSRPLLYNLPIVQMKIRH